jgi:long-chain fatty acid transport protein
MRGLWVGSVAVLLSASTALAGGFSIREQSAEGQGASFAGVAAGTNGLSSMYWNPATLSQHSGNGLMSDGNTSLILPYARAEDGGSAPGVQAPGISDSGNIGKTAIVPASYWIYGVNDDLVLGVSLNAPLGLTTNADNWYGSPHGDKSAVKTLTATPSASYRINELISVGAGVQIEYMSVDINSRTPTGTEIFDAEGDHIGIGFTAGVLFEPTDTTDIGIGFRSSVKHKLEGDGFLMPAAFVGDIEADFRSPETVTVGIRQQVTDQLTIMAGAEWSNWSRFEDLTIKSSASGAAIAQTIEDWNDGWFVSVGVEYAMNDAVALRAGVAFENSPVPDATRTPRIPDNDRIWLSVGASYQITQKMRANLAYTHVFIDDGEVSLAGGGGLPPLNATFEQDVDIIALSLTTDW